ncbi:flagellin Hag [Neobacillus massiliamazoniensis]|jgi:flagellin|uniref:Flagellin n=1 Tax=Neobacillus massiliamazoniensis TaxID=1499688 RepID=A0A0U1NT70_9BACI|nr:flagellin Hag [Neobacillus massiliamazoniensis]CRK80928.1 flagellin domain-containing protein [Neobacillus massiliamazoniensis]
MIINHNLMASNSLRQLGINSNNQSKSMEKLSSGLRINRAGDDAAGLAISEKMRGQIRGLDQASRNAQDGISLIQTAEGSLNETHDILQRMRELAVQSSNDTNVATDRTSIQSEMTQLTRDINRIANNTEFNTQKLLDGSNAAGFTFQVGANEKQTINLKISDMSAKGLTLDAASDETATGPDVTTGANAAVAITTINNAIQTVSTQRSNLGAYQNRLEHTINNLGSSSENLSAAESRIRDVDMAKEMMNQSKSSILSQAAQAMLAQANQQPQQVLQLLRG